MLIIALSAIQKKLDIILNVKQKESGRIGYGTVRPYNRIQFASQSRIIED